jgi:hypothetical protein
LKEVTMGDGIPATSLAVEIVVAKRSRLQALGIVFPQEPVQQWPVRTTAVFDDTCANLIQIAEYRSPR